MHAAAALATAHAPLYTDTRLGYRISHGRANALLVLAGVASKADVANLVLDEPAVG